MQMDISELAYLATGHRVSRFAATVGDKSQMIADAIKGSRVLVVGGAGSIGSATVELIADRQPASLHVLDQNENGLAELVRQLRSRPQQLRVEDFRTLPLDFGDPIASMYLRSERPFDHVLNFSAMKHVRSEKDSFSLLRILQVNLHKLAVFLRQLEAGGHDRRFFSVSTDKAANPTSLMGASKRLMEHVMFSREAAPSFYASMNSARFANVAFSAGSLLEAFLYRVARRQPLAVPRETRRYFVSQREAGEICLLAAFAAQADIIAYPTLDAEQDLVDLSGVAASVLGAMGYSTEFFDTEEAALRACRDIVHGGRYPVLLTPLDTTGEKPYEEFIGSGEESEDIGLANLRGVRYRPAPAGRVGDFLAWLDGVLRQEQEPPKADVVARLAQVVEQMQHVETGKSLDARM